MAVSSACSFTELILTMLCASHFWSTVSSKLFYISCDYTRISETDVSAEVVTISIRIIAINKSLCDRSDLCLESG